MITVVLINQTIDQPSVTHLDHRRRPAGADGAQHLQTFLMTHEVTD